MSYRSRWNWNPDRWGVDVEHLYAGEDYNPEMGFHRRSEGFHRSHGKFEFSPRPTNIRGVRKVAWSADVDYFEDAHGGRVQSPTPSPRTPASDGNTSRAASCSLSTAMDGLP